MYMLSLIFVKLTSVTKLL